MISADIFFERDREKEGENNLKG